MAGRATAGRTAAAAALSALLLATWFVGTVFYSLPSNVVSTRDGGSLRRGIVTVFPQGWGFFTLSPTTEEYVAYAEHDGRLTSLKAAPQSRPANLLGLSRKQRAQGPELAALANEVENWLPCSGGVGPECRDRALTETSNRLRNTSPVATLCGKVVIVSTKPVPWSYRHSYSETRIDETAAAVEVAC